MLQQYGDASSDHTSMSVASEKVCPTDAINLEFRYISLEVLVWELNVSIRFVHIIVIEVLKYHKLCA